MVTRRYLARPPLSGLIDPYQMYHATGKTHVALSTPATCECLRPCYSYNMSQKNKVKERVKQVRIYEKEHGVLRRLAFRKNTTAAEIIRQLIKEA
jgi:hypothetical protein